MLDVGSRPNDNSAQFHQVASVEEQASDWELVLRESHHRMKNTLTLLGASVCRDFRRAGSTDVSVAVDRFERRVVAFGRLYQLLSDDAGRKTISVAVFFESLCGALSEPFWRPPAFAAKPRSKAGLSRRRNVTDLP